MVIVSDPQVDPYSVSPNASANSAPVDNLATPLGCCRVSEVCSSESVNFFQASYIVFLTVDVVISLCWLAMAGTAPKPEMSRWVVIYPIYLNSNKTLAEGRRITASKACDNPTVMEINDCCQYLRLSSLPEVEKAYSRDFMQRGRVRVQLKREDGSLVNPAIPTRKALFLKVAELVPKHHGRSKKQDSASGSSVAAPAGKSGKKKK